MSTATVSSTAGIAPLTKDQAAASVQPIFDKFTHVFGNMPSFFGVMARVPDALTHFVALYGSVIDQGSVEAKYKELAYLKTAQVNGCEYCYRAHSASGRKNGVSEEQIQNLAFYQRSRAFDDKEKAVLAWAERVTRGASAIRASALEEIKRYFNDDQVVELTLTVSIANFTNRFNDALLTTPDIGV
jgi:uncharacterized peroxidase-related enzyme